MVKEGHSKSQVYGLKSKEIKFNKKRDMIDDRLFKDISEELKDFITFFGYSNIGLDPEQLKDNPTAFFYYDESQLSPKQKDQSGGFRAMNAKTLASLGKQSKPPADY